MAVRLRALGARRLRAAVVMAGAGLSLAACVTAPSPSVRLSPGGSGASARAGLGSRPRAYNRPYQVRGRWYTPQDQPGYDRVGLASWYGYESGSRTTADGEVFDARLASAAHTTLPIPSWIEVTNLDNGRSARVRLNDRGPFVSGRILDVSRGAAEELGFLGHGVAHVRVRYIGPASLSAANPPLWAEARPVRPAPTAPPHDYLLASAPVRDLPVNAEVAEDAAAADAADPPPEATGAYPAVVRPQAVAAGSQPAASAGLGFTVQAGAFADRRNALRAAERLGATGSAEIRPLARFSGAVLYRVVVGAWPQADEAAAARDRIVALGFPSAQVIAR